MAEQKQKRTKKPLHPTLIAFDSILTNLRGSRTVLKAGYGTKNATITKIGLQSVREQITELETLLAGETGGAKK